MNYKKVSCLGIHGPFSELFLFKLAIHFSEMGLNVLFISPEQFEELPYNLQFPDKEALKLITFMYVKDVKILLQQINSIYLWHKKPHILILNNFENYLKTFLEQNKKVAFIISFIISATVACANKLGKEIYLVYSSNIDFKESIANIFTEIYQFKVVKLQALTDEIFNEILEQIFK